MMKKNWDKLVFPAALHATAAFQGPTQGGAPVAEISATIHNATAAVQPTLEPATSQAAPAVGVPDLHGDDPTAPNNSSDFKPDYFAVLYMKFGEQPHLTARHAYFKAAAPKDASKDDVGCAINLLKRFTGNPVSGQNCGIQGNVRVDFVGFDFGKKMRIYAFVDNSNIAFNAITPISFTPFGAFDKPGKIGKATKTKNKSFYNARVITFPNAGSQMGLRVDNHLKDGNGDDPKPSDKVYHSINFNLLACKGMVASCDFDDSKRVIPIVVDPDGGNMGGGSPPPG